MKKTNKKTILILTITILLFTTLSILILTNNITYFDTLIQTYIISKRNDTLTKILLTITNLASPIFLIILSISLIIIIKNKKLPIYIVLNLISAFITNTIAKHLFIRQRPININLIEESGYSYPSGHSMVGMSFYIFILYLLLQHIKNKKTKIMLIIIFITITLLIGFSRIYLGVHYPSDVIGGFLLSSIYLTLYIQNIKLEKKWFKWK